MTWDIDIQEEFDDCIFIEGLPGIGNVGKIVVDLLVEEFDGETVATMFSKDLPNAVFVRENNLVELPSIEVKHVEHDDTDFLFLTGDIQPTDAAPSYDFAEAVADYAASQGAQEIITTGGIGLQQLPDDPNAYVTATTEDVLDAFGDAGANTNTHEKVGPIMGITGLLVGVAGKQDIPAAALLGETVAHPKYIGLKGARSVLNVVNDYYDFGVDTQDLDDQIAAMEDELKASLNNFSDIKKAEDHSELGYIG
jgi:hypothetical protein